MEDAMGTESHRARPHLSPEEARLKIARRARRNDAIGTAIAVALVALGVVAALAWWVFLPSIWLLWLFGGLS